MHVYQLSQRSLESGSFISHSVPMVSIFLILIAALLNAEPVVPEQPHILVVIADDLGWNDVGYHGSEIQTPVLDQLSSEGVRLERFYAGIVCTPSRAMFLTGRHSLHTGVHRKIRQSEPSGLPLQFPTLAQELKTQGYSTNLVGKWHLGMFESNYWPQNRGFDTFYGYVQGESDYYTHYSEEYHDDNETWSGLDFWDNDTPMWDNPTYSTLLFSQRSQQIIHQHNGTEPLFLMLSMQAPHLPLLEPPTNQYDYIDIEDSNRRVYAKMVSYMDAEIGTVVDALKTKGMWQNTIMLFFSDNGGNLLFGASNEPLLGGKNEVYEGGVRCPAFVTGGLIPTPGVVSEDYVHVTDWFPTLLYLAGVNETDTGLYGYNIWEMFSEGTPSPRTEILVHAAPYSEILFSDMPNPKNATTAIIQNHWKLVTGYMDEIIWESVRLQEITQINIFIELFNITADPGEQLDVSSLYPEVVLNLLQRLVTLEESRVPAIMSCLDPRADPALHNNTWLPWLPWGYALEPEVKYACVHSENDTYVEYLEWRYLGIPIFIVTLCSACLVFAGLLALSIYRRRYIITGGYEQIH